MQSKFKIPAIIFYGVFVLSSILMAHILYMHMPPAQWIFNTTTELDAYISKLNAANTPYVLDSLYYDFFFMVSIAFFGWIICSWMYQEFSFKNANKTDGETGLVRAKQASFLHTLIIIVAIVLGVYLYLDLYENIHLIKRIHGEQYNLEQIHFGLKQKLKYILSFGAFIVLYLLAIYRSVLVAKKEKRKNRMLLNNILALAGHVILVLIGLGIMYLFHNCC